MRTPRPFLGIFALALLLPLLLLACGGSEEPANGPATATAEAAQGPTTEVAEPSPTPRATDEPESRTSSGQTTAEPASLETDREALVALYNATGGPNWRRNNNWLSDAPISEWEGVTTDGNGRVTELDLHLNQLRGEIPPELGNLANLTRLDLSGNQFSGCVPSSLSGQLNMQYSDLGGLRFCP